MTITTVEAVEQKLYELETRVQREYLKKGVVLPKSCTDGTIQLLNYSVYKEGGYYQVLDSRSRSIVENINLAMTAVLAANQLATKRFIDQNILDYDQNYGYACFEIARYQSLIKQAKKTKKWDNVDNYQLKLSIAKQKSRQFRLKIVKQFERLSRSVAAQNK